MTEMHLDGRSAARLRRWRRLRRTISGSLAVAAIGGGVYLGVTGPLVSPVQPPAVAAAVAPAPAAVEGGRDPQFAGRGAGGRGVRDADFGQGRRR